MPRDFTVGTYHRLCRSLIGAGHEFVTVEQYAAGAPGRVVIMRHDVDRKPSRALDMARVEADLGVRASYFFRIVSESWDPAIMKSIADLGHEIGYHYEDLTIAQGDTQRAAKLFASNLMRFRDIYPVRTICMHGSPASRWDNRDLWSHADYREQGIVAEPYLDFDYSKLLYVSDTGRGWNRRAYSRRDFIEGGLQASFDSTFEFIRRIDAGDTPDRIMINTHPERWTDSRIGWAAEVLTQAAKRPIKAVVVRFAPAR